MTKCTIHYPLPFTKSICYGLSDCQAENQREVIQKRLPNVLKACQDAKDAVPAGYQNGLKTERCTVVESNSCSIDVYRWCYFLQ